VNHLAAERDAAADNDDDGGEGRNKDAGGDVCSPFYTDFDKLARASNNNNNNNNNSSSSNSNSYRIPGNEQDARDSRALSSCGKYSAIDSDIDTSASRSCSVLTGRQVREIVLDIIAGNIVMLGSIDRVMRSLPCRRPARLFSFICLKTRMCLRCGSSPCNNILCLSRNLCTIHAKRVTIMTRDIHLACCTRGQYHGT